MDEPAAPGFRENAAPPQLPAKGSAADQTALFAQGTLCFDRAMLSTSAQQTEQAGKIYELTPLLSSIKIPNPHRLEEKMIKVEFFHPSV